MMNILLFLFMLAVGGLVAYSIRFLLQERTDEESQRKEAEKKEASHRLEILRFDETIKAQEADLENLRKERQKLLNDLDSANKIETGLKEEIAKIRQDTDRTVRDKESLIQQLREEIMACKGAEKEKSGLEHNVGELERELESLKKRVQDSDKIKEELAVKDQQLQALRESQGISVEQYNELKKKLESAEKTLKIIHGEVGTESN